MATIDIVIGSLWGSSFSRSYSVNPASTTLDGLVTLISDDDSISPSYYDLCLSRNHSLNNTNNGSSTLNSLGVVNGDGFIVSIKKLDTKEERLKQKLDIAQAKRQADGDTTARYYRSLNIYDLSLLPTQYEGNDRIDNPNPGGLQTGRPWLNVVENNPSLLFDLSADNNSSYPGSGSTWYDISTNDRNFTLYNTPTYTKTTPGYFSFNPASLEYGDTPSLGNLSNWSVEAWFRVTTSLATKEATAVVTTVYEDGAFTGHRINFVIGTGSGTYANNLCVGFFDGSWHKCTAITPTLNTWYHMVGTYNGSVLKQYVNGSLNASLNYAGTSTAAGGKVRIARRWDGPQDQKHYFPGDIGSVRVYSGELDADQVASNYNVEKSRFGL